MNLYCLPTHVMLAHSHTWLSTPEVYDVLAGDPLGRAMLDKLRLAHNDLSERQHYRSILEQHIAQLSSKLVGLDGIHDGIIRALYYHLTALSCACTDADRAQEYLDLRDLLLPEGLAAVNHSYLAQTGAVVELQKRVTPEVHARLARMPFDGRTLADLYDELVDVGETMGELTQKRTSLVASMRRDGTESASVDLDASRRQWVRTVATLLKTLNLVSIPAKTRELMMAPLERSIREALRSRQDDEDTGDADLEQPDGALPRDEAPGSAGGAGEPSEAGAAPAGAAEHGRGHGAADAPHAADASAPAGRAV